MTSAGSSETKWFWKHILSRIQHSAFHDRSRITPRPTLSNKYEMPYIQVDSVFVQKYPNHCEAYCGASDWPWQIQTVGTHMRHYTENIDQSVSLHSRDEMGKLNKYWCIQISLLISHLDRYLCTLELSCTNWILPYTNALVYFSLGSGSLRPTVELDRQNKYCHIQIFLLTSHLVSSIAKRKDYLRVMILASWG